MFDKIKDLWKMIMYILRRVARSLSSRCSIFQASQKLNQLYICKNVGFSNVFIEWAQSLGDFDTSLLFCLVPEVWLWISAARPVKVLCHWQTEPLGNSMDETVSLDVAVDDFSSEHELESLIENLKDQDLTLLLGIFVSLAVVIITIGEPSRSTVASRLSVAFSWLS